MARSIVLWSFSACLAVGLSVPVGAQPLIADPNAAVQLPSEGAWSLVQALSTALRRNRDIVVAETTVAASRGNVQTAAGAFDLKLNASTELNEDRAASLRQNTSSVGVQQMLRDGTVLEGTVSAAGQKSFVEGGGSGSQDSAGVRVTFPLLRGRGTQVITANENIQRLILESNLHALRETAGLQIFSTTQAYWRLRAADETLAVLREAEARAERQVRDTQRLILGGEQPASNVNLAQATLNSRRAARLDGERALADARLVLGELLGLDYPQTRSVVRTADTFPVGTGDPIGTAAATQLVDAAMRQRFNLRAAEAVLDAQRLNVIASRDNLQPLLNASVQVGMAGRAPSESPIEPLVRGRIGQRQLSASLVYQWDVGNNDARGRYVTASANYDQQSAVVQGVRRSIGTGVESAVANYNATLAQLAQSRQTVDLFSRAVDGERSKLRLNSATLLDVVNVENSLQQALVQHINTMAAHAVAIASLRYQTGELIREEPQSQLLPIELLFTWRGPAAAAPAR